MIAALPTTAESGRPAAEALGHHHQVGLDAGVLVAEHPAGPAEAALHLVGDEHDAVRSRAVRGAAAGTRRRRHEAALAELAAR